MPRFLLTAELRDASGQVVAARRRHFHVLTPGQDGEQDVLWAIYDLERADAALLAAEREVVTGG